MLVGWGGNNGTTVTGGVLANKLCVGGVGGGAPRIFAGAALRRVRAGGRAAAAGAWARAWPAIGAGRGGGGGRNRRRPPAARRRPPAADALHAFPTPSPPPPAASPG